MQILITNDDGYQAKGIQSLITLMQAFGTVTVVAPEGPRSGQSSAISVGVPIRVRKVREAEGLVVYACSGTPADCVKWAFNVLYKDAKPDLLVSGINHGSNASVNVVYSGTMGACFVGAENNVLSVGLSLCDHAADADFSTFATHIPHLITTLLQKKTQYGVCFNINAPVGDIKGLRVTRQCEGHWEKEFVSYTDPAGQTFYMLTGSFVNHEPDAQDTDEWALAHGFISVTPTSLDMTSYAWKNSINIG